MKILLINPPNTILKDSVKRLPTPLGLMYIAQITENNGHYVQILDCPCDGYEHEEEIDKDHVRYGTLMKRILSIVQNIKPDVVGISNMFTSQFQNTLDCASAIKQAHEDIQIVLGGVHPSIFSKKVEQHECVDKVIIGEGEYKFLNYLEGLDNNVPLISNLDDIPFPARHLVNMKKYIDINVPMGPFPRRKRVEQIITSRGCPCRCNFCSSRHIWKNCFRQRSVSNVIQEIDLLIDRYDIEEIQFTDDNLTVNKNYAKRLFRQLAKREIDFCTPNGLFTQSIDNELIDLMSKAGAYQVTLAIESASDRILKDVIHKKVPSKDRVQEMIERFRNNGVQVHGTFIVGFPEETEKEMIETLEYPFDVEFSSVSYFIATPLPGSDLYQQCLKDDLFDSDSKSYDFKTGSIKHPIVPKERLEKMVNTYTQRFNEYAKATFPEEWSEKFRVFQEHNQTYDVNGSRAT